MMKKIALMVTVAVLCLGASIVAADPVATWVVERDSSIRTKPGLDVTRGTTPTSRIVTSTWDGMWFGDWSATAKTEISDMMATNPGEGMKWELRLEVMNSAATVYAAPPYEWTVAAFKAQTDWTEAGACWESPNYPTVPVTPGWTKADGTAVGKFAVGSGLAGTINVDNAVNTNIFSGLPANGEFTGCVLNSVLRSWILSDATTSYVRGLVFLRSRLDDGGIMGATIVTNDGDLNQAPRLALYAVAATPGVYTWVGGGGADTRWSQVLNWEEGTAPTLLTDTANFPLPPTGLSVAIGSGDVHVGTINVTGGSGKNFTVTQDAVSTLEVGTLLSIDAGAVTIGAPVLGAGSRTITASAATAANGTVAINAPWTGGAGTTITASGAVTISGQWQAGGTTSITSGGAVTVSAAFQPTGSTTINATGAANFNAAVQTDASMSVTATGAVNFNAALSGAGSMSISPGANSAINQANTMTGGLTFTGSTNAITLTLPVAGSGGGTPGTKAPITVNKGILKFTDAAAIQNVSTITLSGDSHLNMALPAGGTVTTNVVIPDGTTLADIYAGTDKAFTLDGTITIGAGGEAKISKGAVGTNTIIFTVASKVIGTDGKFVVDVGTNGYMPMVIANNTANDYTGGTDIRHGGLLYVHGATKGPITVAGDYGTSESYWNGYGIYRSGLRIVGNPAGTTPAITVNPGGPLGLSHTANTGSTTFTNLGSVTLAGGALLGPGMTYAAAYGAGYGAVTVNNDIAVTADSFVHLGNAGVNSPAGDFTLAGRLSGAGKLTVTTVVDGRGSKLILTADNTAGTPWSGGLDVTRGMVEAATSAGALGTGAIVAREGGTVRTSVDGAFTNTQSVSIQAGGTWLQNSTETKAVTIESRGALLKDAGGTLTAAEFNPSGGHITLNKGAMINKAALDAIDAGFDRNWLDGGDDGYGVWLANSSVDIAVGDGDLTGVPIRGISATMWSSTSNSNDREPYFVYKNATLSEAEGGTLGIFLSAASLQTGLQIGTGSSGAANTATLNPLPGHKIHVTGPGVVLLRPYNTYGGDIDVETTGNGWLKIGWYSEVDPVIPGKTVTIKNGAAAENWTYTGAGSLTVLKDSTINVEGGGVFRLRGLQSDVTGSVAQGAVLLTDSLANLTTAGTNWTFTSGSHVALSKDYAAAAGGVNDPYPGRGASNFVILSDPGGNTFKPGYHLYLNDSTRVLGAHNTVDATAITLQSAAWTTDKEMYQVRPFAGSTKVTLAAETNRTLTVNMKVNANTNSNDAAVSGTLLVGDERVDGSPGTFKTYAGYWYEGQYTPPNNPFPGLRNVTTGGMVALAHSNNAMDAINVRSGTLQAGTTSTIPVNGLAGYLGGAKTIRVATGATLAVYHTGTATNQTLSTMITGGAGASAADKAYINFNSTARVLTLTPSGASTPAGINPGDGALAGQLSFNSGLAFADDGVNYPSLTIDVVGGGMVPGVDYDQVTLTGAVTQANMAASLDLAVNFGPGATGSPNPLEGDVPIILNADLATFTAGDYGSEGILKVDPDEPLTWVYLFHKVTWTSGSGKVQVLPGNLRQVVLTNLVARIPGDADLNGYVDLPDLIALARNWKVTPATWGQGDFDGDNIVDLPDLIILARNWHAGSLPPAAGGAVPEPASLALLALGGIALVRRRRR